MEIVDGTIVNVDEHGLTIFCPYKDIDRLSLRKYAQVQVGLPDGRHITPNQRKKAWALMGEIGDFMGYYGQRAVYKWVYEVQRRVFKEIYSDTLRYEDFHLSTADVTTAGAFIDYLVELMITEDIPSRFPLYTKAEDIGRYVWVCFINHKCAVCGAPADLHHVDRVGMGRNRRQIPQIGMRVLPLCRCHHQEDHQHGERVFYEKYRLIPLKLTEQNIRQAADIYHFTEANMEEEI